MAMSKEQAEVVADALCAPVRQGRARLERIREADNRGVDRPWLHVFSGTCFFIAASLFAWLAASQSSKYSAYWLVAALFVLNSILQFAAHLRKRRT